MRSIPISSKVRPILFSAIFYAALAVLFVMPVLVRGTNYLLGDDSAGLNLWSVWWPLHAIPGNYNLIYNNYTLFPLNTNILPLLSLPTSLLYSLFRPVLGPIMAFNMILPVYCTLNGLAGFLFLRGRLANFRRALVAGALIAFNPLTYGLAHQADITLLPFFVFLFWILLWERFLQKRDIGHAILLALGLYVVVLTSMQYWSLIFIVLLPYAVLTFKRRGDWRELIDPLLWGLLLICIMFLIYPASALNWAANLPSISGRLVIWQAVNFPPLLFWIFVVILVAVIFRAIRGNTLDPQLRLVGVAIGGICVLCYQVPQLSPLLALGVTRADNPVRLQILWMPVIVFGVFALFRDTPPITLFRRWKRVQKCVVCIGLLAISGWWQFLPAVAVPYLKWYDKIANDPEDYVVADFPAGIDTLERRSLAVQGQQPANVPSVGTAYSAGQILMSVPFYQKHVIGGLTTFLGSNGLKDYQTSSLLQLLTTQEIGGYLPDDAEIMRNDSARWRIGYILVHRNQLNPDFLNNFHQWMAWINAYCMVDVEDTTEVWQARWHPNGCPPEVLHLGANDNNMVLATGWYGEEVWGDLPIRWAGTQTTSYLSFWVTPSSDYRLTLRVSAPQSENQTLTVAANGETLGKIALEKNWQDYSLTVPRTLISQTNGLLSLQLQHDHLDNVQGRMLTAAYDTISLEAITP